MTNNNWREEYDFETDGNWSIYQNKHLAREIRESPAYIKHLVYELIELPLDLISEINNIKEDPERSIEHIQTGVQLLNRLVNAATASDEGYSEEMVGGARKKSKRKSKKRLASKRRRTKKSRRRL